MRACTWPSSNGSASQRRSCWSTWRTEPTMGGDSRLAGFLAVHRTSSVAHLTELLVATIIAGNPGYDAAGVVPLADLERSCEDNVLRVLGPLRRASCGARGCRYV